MLVFAACAANLARAESFSVSNTQGLAFGAMVTGTTAGTVSVSTNGLRACGGGVTCIGQFSASAAGFSVTGDPSAAYIITLSNETTMSDSAGNSMNVDGFEDSKGGSGILSSTGEMNFSVGATLNIDGGQPAGAYSGSFDVIIEYQ